MRILDLGPGAARQITGFGSSGASALPVLRSDDVAVTVLRVARGGQIGRHPAVAEQLLVVVSGSGGVSGGDGGWRPIAAGQAVIWSAGEQHATRADEDMTAVVVEMRELPLASGR